MKKKLHHFILTQIVSINFDKKYYINTYSDITVGSNPVKDYVINGWYRGRHINDTLPLLFYQNLYIIAYGKKQLCISNYLAAVIYTKFGTKATNKKLKKVQMLKQPKYYLALVAIFQNEARFLKEWIEFYILQGVELFILYNHLSTDDYKSVLQPYINKGILELRHVFEIPESIHEWRQIQRSTFEIVIKELAQDAEWLIIVDTDEFMFPIIDCKLCNFLKKYDDYAAVCANWRLFGSHTVNQIAPKDLLIEKLTMSKPFNHFGMVVKSVVKPRYCKYEIGNVHNPNLSNGYSSVTENYEFFRGIRSPTYSTTLLQVNHYIFRDWNFFYKHKISRMHCKDSVYINYKELSYEEKKKKYILENQSYSVSFNDSILKYIDILKSKIA